MLTVLCHTTDDDGNSFTDEDVVNHMIFLMMAAHDTSTSTLTTMAYHLAANPYWQERCREESARLGDGPLDIDALEKLETLDLVINESLRLVTPLPFNVRRTVRDTELLATTCRRAPTSTCGPRSTTGCPSCGPTRRSSIRTASPSPAPSTSGTGTPSPRSAAARTSASGWCSASWRSRRSCTDCCAGTGSSRHIRTTGRATTTRACRCRSTACRSCCARCADQASESMAACSLAVTSSATGCSSG